MFHKNQQLLFEGVVPGPYSPILTDVSWKQPYEIQGNEYELNSKEADWQFSEVAMQLFGRRSVPKDT